MYSERKQKLGKRGENSDVFHSGNTFVTMKKTHTSSTSTSSQKTKKNKKTVKYKKTKSSNRNKTDDYGTFFLKKNRNLEMKRWVFSEKDLFNTTLEEIKDRNEDDVDGKNQSEENNQQDKHLKKNKFLSDQRKINPLNKQTKNRRKDKDENEDEKKEKKKEKEKHDLIRQRNLDFLLMNGKNKRRMMMNNDNKNKLMRMNTVRGIERINTNSRKIENRKKMREILKSSKYKKHYASVGTLLKNNFNFINSVDSDSESNDSQSKFKIKKNVNNQKNE